MMVECKSNTVKSTHPSRLEVVSLSSSTFRGGGIRDQIFVACHGLVSMRRSFIPARGEDLVPRRRRKRKRWPTFDTYSYERRKSLQNRQIRFSPAASSPTDVLLSVPLHCCPGSADLTLQLQHGVEQGLGSWWATSGSATTKSVNGCGISTTGCRLTDDL